jgi:[CysO sulfur-carrier protein]-S-L-cysteine hydrolase
MTCALPNTILEQLRQHAVSTFPDECCGIVVERHGALAVVRVTNVQNERHAAYPDQFPRTAATAYTMGPEAAPVLVDHDRGRLTIRAIYHSHPQHAAYFSAEDKAQATVWDEPSYPDATQIVVSVIDGVVRDVKAFRWDAPTRDFIAVELRGV